MCRTGHGVWRGVRGFHWLVVAQWHHAARRGRREAPAKVSAACACTLVSCVYADQKNISPRSVGLFEAFYSSMKPITLLAADIEIAEGGRLEEGETEFPFEFDVDALEGQELLETYHGVFVNITYEVTVTMTRGAFSKDLMSTEEFYVQIPVSCTRFFLMRVSLTTYLFNRALRVSRLTQANSLSHQKH